jgi:hypothetical protein
MSVSQDTQVQKLKKNAAVKPPAMDTALGECTYQEQVMNSYGKGNPAPFIPNLSAEITIEWLALLLRIRPSPRTKSQP